MSKIRDMIRVETNSVGESSSLITTDKLLIVENKVVLSDKIKGDIVWNKVMIYEDVDSNNILKFVTCTTNENVVTFDPADNLDGKYCVFSYLTVRI